MPPDGPITVGIDGGYVRAAHKEGFFEVIAGRSVVAFRRAADDEVPESKCFGYVQTYDEKPRRRLFELMKSQGLQDNQQVVFMSDGGEDVRRVQTYLHPDSEHWIDWFHITMRITVMTNMSKSLQPPPPDPDLELIPEVMTKLIAEVREDLVRLKWFLWHGNVFRALQTVNGIIMDLETLNPGEVPGKLLTAMREFDSYIRANAGRIPNYGERRRAGEAISTAFVESTVNNVISKRMVKRQQMRWSPRGAHLLLQVRTRVLNDQLADDFHRWYPNLTRAPNTPAPALAVHLVGGSGSSSRVVKRRGPGRLRGRWWLAAARVRRCGPAGRSGRRR